MRRRTLERIVGMSLLLGPLAYALTLQPQVVEVVEVVEVTKIAEVAEAAPTLVPDVIPEVAPTPVSVERTPAVPPTSPSEGRLSFAFVNEAGLVLSTEAKTAWGKGRLRAHAGPAQFQAAKRADAHAIPEDLWAQRGRTFDLYGADGKVCTARLGTLSVLAQHDGPSLFDLYYDENDQEPEVNYDTFYDTFEATAHPPAQIRRKVWSQAAGSEYGTVWLVASLSSDTPCKGALWARDHELPAPVILRASNEPSALTQQKLAQHESSERLAQTRRDHTAWYDELSAEDREYADTWATIVEHYPATLRTWLDDRGHAALVELEFGYEGEPCSDDFDSSIATVELVIDGRFEPTERATNPIAVFDADLDGRFEMLYQDLQWGWVNQVASETLETWWEIDAIPICPC
ncbi:MAG: hypothetical protein AAGF11_54070 [Myxococcota bacterium]